MWCGREIEIGHTVRGVWGNLPEEGDTARADHGRHTARAESRGDTARPDQFGAFAARSAVRGGGSTHRTELPVTLEFVHLN